MFRWLKSLFVSRSQPSADGVRAARSEAAAKVEKLKAEFEAATKLWPRNQAAITAAWIPFRDARCDQIRSEMGR